MKTPKKLIKQAREWAKNTASFCEKGKPINYLYICIWELIQDRRVRKLK